MRLKVLTVLMSCFICKPLNYQIAGRDTTASDLDFFMPINVNEMQANWDQATFQFIPSLKCLTRDPRVGNVIE